MRLFRVALAVVGSLVSLTALMPLPLRAQDLKNVPASKAPRTFVSIKGAKQGQFPGDAVTAGHTAEIAASSFSFEIVTPIDANSGMVTGKRQYKPLVFTHSVSVATPLLFSAAATNEVLTSVVFTVVRTVSGKSENYTVTLTNARVISVRQYTVDSDPMEEVSLTFQAIAIEVGTGGKKTLDSWSATM